MQSAVTRMHGRKPIHLACGKMTWRKSLRGLISEKYLDEERYATQFARSHLNQKKWGRVKISYELKQRQVSNWCIKNALKQINEEEYMQVFRKLAEDKWELLSGEENEFSRKKKLQDYLVQKGFERDLVFAELKKISTE